MRKPTTIEYLYLDFDGFFAAVEEQARPRLRGKAIGVVPFNPVDERGKPIRSMIIAANRKAKLKGVKTGTTLTDARILCPGIELVPQSPDLYERAHRKLLLLIHSVIPIGGVSSIDELSCKLEPPDIADPLGLSHRIKARILDGIGPYITCSIGFAPNRQLAKIASDMDKPNGCTVLRPEDLPGRLLDLPITDIPGVGGRMKDKLYSMGIWSTEQLWNTQPKQLRKIWGNVHGERMWYALHGYEVISEPSKPMMFGHGRVLPPEWRDFDNAFNAARLLTIKAARRLRRAKFLADTFELYLSAKDDKWSGGWKLGQVNDDQAGVNALSILFKHARSECHIQMRIIRVHVAFTDLTPEGERQLDIFNQDDRNREKWSKLCKANDALNTKYAKTVVSMGKWSPPPGGYAGGKISYTRVPDMEDFW